MKREFILYLLLLSITSLAQKPIIAIVEPQIIGETEIEKKIIIGELSNAIDKYTGYETVTRSKEDINLIIKEKRFRDVGMVNIEQCNELGQVLGVDYICVSSLTKSKDFFYFEAYLLHLESGKKCCPVSKFGEIVENETFAGKLYSVCQAAAKELAEKISPISQDYIIGNEFDNEEDGQNIVVKYQNFTENINGVSFTMVYVEGGTFIMGCRYEQDSDCYDNEKPAHSVTLSDYYIGETEVTQGLWHAVMGNNPSSFIKGDNYPVEFVSWNDAMEFCTRLSDLTGRTYTLPTEAQWEYAARGGNKSREYIFSGGENLDNFGWYENNSDATTHPVKSKQSNELGLYDMSGNVDEWCKDWYDSYSLYSQMNTAEPSSDPKRIFRGGSWEDWGKDCRVASRRGIKPVWYSPTLGFRIVLLP